MFPKQLLIQSTSNNFIFMLNSELLHIPSIRYNYYKINGLYTISIKCSNYYQKFSSTVSDSFYGSYIYLYTNISLLLSTMLISYYEKILIKRILHLNYFYFNNTEQKKIFNIASSILDPNYPYEINKNLYMYRKGTVLNNLLEIFRKSNHLNIESIINFGMVAYKKELEYIVDKAVSLFISDISYIELINLIIDDWPF